MIQDPERTGSRDRRRDESGELPIVALTSDDPGLPGSLLAVAGRALRSRRSLPAAAVGPTLLVLLLALNATPPARGQADAARDGKPSEASRSGKPGELLEGELPVRAAPDLVGRRRFPSLRELEAIIDGDRRRPLFVLRVAKKNANISAPRWSGIKNHAGLAFRSDGLDAEQGKVSLQAAFGAETKPIINDEFSYESLFYWGLGEQVAGKPTFALVSNVSGSSQIHVGVVGGPEPLPVTGGEETKRHPGLFVKTDGDALLWRLAFDAGRELAVLDFPELKPGLPDRDKRMRRVLGRGTQPRWSPGGDRLAFIREIYGKGDERDKVVRQEVVMLTFKLSNPVLVHSGEPGQILRSPEWSPDGKRLAFFLRREGVDPIWDLYECDVSSRLNQATRVAGQIVVNAVREHLGPAWSADSRRLYYFSQTVREEEYYPLLSKDVVTGKLGKLSYPRAINVANDVASRGWADGDIVAFTGIDRGPRELYIAVLPSPKPKSGAAGDKGKAGGEKPDKAGGGAASPGGGGQ